MTDSIGGGLWLGRYQALMSGSFVEFSLVVLQPSPPRTRMFTGKYQVMYKYVGSNVHH